MTFWVARAGGDFQREGIDVELVVPEVPQATTGMFESHAADAAVLPPPMFLNLIAKGQPAVLVANLLKNDPIDLVVHRRIAEERHITPTMALRDRLTALRGLKIGVAPHPPTRLRALFASVGLDADREVELVTLHGKEQNAAFAKNEVDGLYAHTPYLERSIVHDDAVMVVEQTRGEVAALADREIHGLVFERDFIQAHREVVAGAVRAIAAAEKRIHESEPATVSALVTAFPARERREIETIVHLYQPAIPERPSVSVEDLTTGITLFPAGQKPPELGNVDLRAHVATEFAGTRDAAGASREWWIVAAVAVLVVLSVVAGVRLRRRSDTA
jgi:ABC-type nitrate/sulfonate/bicarbonate transport system substrate-binding protein